MADGSVIIDVELNTGKAETQYNNLGSKLSSATGKMASVMKAGAVATLAGITAIGAGAVKIGKDVVASYADYEQLVGGVETLFGAGGQSLEQFAKSAGKSVDSVKTEYSALQSAQDIVMNNASNAYKTAGMSVNEYMNIATTSAAAMVKSVGGDTVKAAKLTDQAVTDMADNANKYGTSMESVQNAYGGFAKGNFTMLDNLKIGYGGTKEEMQKLLTDAEKLPSAMGRKFDISNYADITEAIHLVQTEMGITGTTAKEASQTISGSIDSTKAAYANLITGLGDENANIQVLVDNLMNSLTNVINNITPIIANLIKALPTAITGIVSAIGKLLPTVFQTVASLFNTLLKTIVDLIPKLIPSLSSGLLSMVQSILEQLPNLIQAGIQIVMALLQGIAEALPKMTEAMATALTSLINVIVQNAPMLIEQIVLIITTLGNTISEQLPTLLPLFVNAIVQIAGVILENLPTLILVAMQIILALVQGLSDALPQLLGQMEIIIPQVANVILSNLPLFISMAIQIIVALVRGLSQAGPQVFASINTIINKMLSNIGSFIGGFASKGLQIISNFINGLKGKSPTQIFKDFSSSVGSLLGGINLFKQGSAIIDGFLNGLKSSFNNVKDFVGGIGDWIAKNKGPLPYDRKLLIPAGNAIMEGLDEGLIKKFEAVKKTIRGVAGDIFTTFDGSVPNLDNALKVSASVGTSTSDKQENSQQNANIVKKLGEMADALAEVNNRRTVLTVNGTELAEATWGDYEKVKKSSETRDKMLGK